MSMKSYINDIWEAVSTTAKGMRITGRVGIDVKEEVTIQYPEQRAPIFERSRGFLQNDINTCISCNMCVKICPVDCISLEAVRGADKKMVLVSYDINIGRCMYCGLCVEVCPVKSLTHSHGFERAMQRRDEMVLHFIHEDAAVIRQRVAKAVAEAAAKAATEAKAVEAQPKPAAPPADTEKK
ncbi:MAG TPA: NADH-quinone oxidoreductase subunit I [Candidatus Deferrimicrobiaceae bacterium]|jgi:NADH-quinone oxidoreductase subunit I